MAIIPNHKTTSYDPARDRLMAAADANIKARLEAEKREREGFDPDIYEVDPRSLRDPLTARDREEIRDTAKRSRARRASGYTTGSPAAYNAAHENSRANY